MSNHVRSTGISNLFSPRLLSVLVLMLLSAVTTMAANPHITQLTVNGSQFVNSSGQVVRFWGVNTSALYPDSSAVCNALAANLESMQVNLVRPHHMLRKSLDWNPDMVSGALVTYQNDTSRVFDPVAIDKFDRLNAALRARGIYLSFALDWTRRYRAGDVDILTTNPADRTAWMAAMNAQLARPWQEQMDTTKMLPMIDERCALVHEEFARNLLNHVNPYTGTPYRADSQVLMIELMNEFSTEYAVICNNRLPQYWDDVLDAKWNAYCAANGIPTCDLYAPSTNTQKQGRAAFLRKLDQDFFNRMKAVVQSTGSQAPLFFGNLWRGENSQQFWRQSGNVFEDHVYCRPQDFYESLTDGFYSAGRMHIAAKPFFIGEFNETEANIATEGPFRSTLMAAGAAYGKWNMFSGIEWFALLHGDSLLGSDGWATAEARTPNLGNLLADGMMLDHMRTAGTIFRDNVMVSQSLSATTMYVDDPLWAGGFTQLMAGKYMYKPGWQCIYSMRKQFGTVPAGQATANWMTTTPTSPLISDTGQLVKNTTRKQFTLTASRAETFSGRLDGNPPQGPTKLKMGGHGSVLPAYATVILVSIDGTQPLQWSTKLLLSRTAMNSANAEVDVLVYLTGIKAESGGQGWYIKQTRPRVANPTEQRLYMSNGELVLPLSTWHECELSWH